MLGRIFKKTKEERKDVDIDSIPQMIEESFDSEISSFRSKSSSHVNKIANSMSELKKIYEELKEKSTQSTYANSVKNRLCDNALDSIKVIHPELTYRDLMDYVNILRSMLAEIGDINYREAIHLYAFKPEMSEIAKKTSSVLDDIKAMEKTLDNNTIKSIASINKAVETIKKKDAEINDFSDLIVSIKNNIDAERKNLSEMQELLNKFMSDPRFSRLESLNEHAKRLESEKKRIEDKISRELSGITRILKKYRHEKKVKGMVNGYIENSTKAFINDNDMEIKSILDRAIRFSVESGEPDEDTERLQSALENIDSIKPLSKRYAGIDSEMEEINEKIYDLSAVYKEKETIEKDIESVKKTIETMGNNLEAKINALENMKVEKNVLKSGLEKSIRNMTGHEIIILNSSGNR